MPKASSDKDEAKLEQLAKKLLSTKPKPRQDLKKGKDKTKGAKSSPRK